MLKSNALVLKRPKVMPRKIQITYLSMLLEVKRRSLDSSRYQLYTQIIDRFSINKRNQFLRQFLNKNISVMGIKMRATLKY